MTWLVVAPVEGVGPTRIVAESSWKGWPKAKDPMGQLIEGQKMAGKYRYHVIGESPDGKSIPAAVPKQKKPISAPLEALPEVVEIVSRKKQLEEEQEAPAQEEALEAVEVVDPNEPAPVVAQEPKKSKGGRPRKNAK